MQDGNWEGAFEGPGINETMRERQEYEANQKWIVDPIFPAGAMHLLGGPSGAGKTTWLLQFLWEWEQGLPIFGQYTSSPVPWVYICCDRSLRETTQTLLRLDYHNWHFESHSLEDLLPKASGKITESPDIVKHVLNKFGYAELIVIEGLQALMPDVARGRSQNKQELLWALEVRNILGPQNRTIIATTHSPKVNTAGNVAGQDARSKFLGTAGFIGTCSTMIGFDKDEKKPDCRNVKVMGRNFRDIDLVYSLDDRGKFLLEAVGKESMFSQTDLDVQIFSLAAGLKQFTAAEMHKQIGTDVSLRWVQERLRRLVEQNTIEECKMGAGRATVYKYGTKTQ